MTAPSFRAARSKVSSGPQRPSAARILEHLLLSWQQQAFKIAAQPRSRAAAQPRSGERQS
jgi:hypothetical protein